MGHGIISYAAYVPRHRLTGAEIASALGGGGGKGSRAVASFDEDTTTLAVEAARPVVHVTQGADPIVPGSLVLATTSPAYLDKTNAAAVHVALDLPHDGFAVDAAGSPRSAVGALRTAAATGGLAVLSDLRTGLPGSAEERSGGDAAAAFLFGEADRPAAEIVAQASATAEFLDRWRLPGETASRQWEERFGLEVYAPLIADVARRALGDAGIETPDHVVVLVEMIHDARIIPLDRRPHLDSDIKQWLGDSRGWWEGDTLVVETNNLTSKAADRTRTTFGAGRQTTVVERFTRTSADTMNYQITVADPTEYSASWTAAIPMTALGGQLYEYACHEGNYAIGNILSGARAEEKATH